MAGGLSSMMDWIRSEEVLDSLKTMRTFGNLAKMTVLTTLRRFISKSNPMQKSI